VPAIPLPVPGVPVPAVPDPPDPAVPPPSSGLGAQAPASAAAIARAQRVDEADRVRDAVMQLHPRAPLN